MADRHPASREKVAQSLLGVVQQLSTPAFIFRPFDHDQQRDATEKITMAQGDLVELGYASDSAILSKLSSAVQALQTPSFSLSYSAVLAIIPTLIQAIDALSLSTTPFPVPNRHPPPEILDHIYQELLEEEDSNILRSTIHALSRTSIAWRRIVLPWCKHLYLGNRTDLERWLGSKTLKGWDETGFEDQNVIEFDRADNLDELHIDLSRDDLRSFDPSLLRHVLSRNPETPKMLIINLDAEEDELPFDRRGPWSFEMAKLVQPRSNYSIRMPAYDGGEMRWCIDLCLRGQKEVGRIEVYFGRSECPLELVADDLQSCIDEEAEEQAIKPIGGFPYPIFTRYTVFSAPHLVFTVPLFLLRTTPQPVPSLEPSKLVHLELTLELDPLNGQAESEMQEFFDMISPRIERLALRIRLDQAWPRDYDRWMFTQDLVQRLRGCPRLRHLEIGGFAFSPDLPAQLSSLPLDTLIVLPLQFALSFEWIKALLPSYGPRTLRTLGVNEGWKNEIANLMLPGDDDYETLCRRCGVTIVEYNRDRETDWLKIWMAQVGVES